MVLGLDVGFVLEEGSRCLRATILTGDLEGCDFCLTKHFAIGLTENNQKSSKSTRLNLQGKVARRAIVLEIV